MGFRHAHRQVTVAEFFQVLQGFARVFAKFDVGGAVEFLRDGADFFDERQVVQIERRAAALFLFAGVDYGAGERFAAFAAMRPYFAQRDFHAALGAGFFYQRQFGVAVALEAVDGDDHRQAEGVFQVVDVFEQVGQAFFQRGDVFRAERVFADAAVVFERAHGGDDDGAVGLEPALTAFDVDEFFRAQIRAKARLGHGVVAKCQRAAGGDEAVAAVGDVGEGSAVDERRRAFDGLHQIGLDGVFEQRRHRALRLQIAHVNGFAATVPGDNHRAEAVFEVGQIARETEGGHDFAGDGDVEAVRAQGAVHRFAEAADDVAQLAVVHIDRAPPSDAFRVDVERVAVVDVVVDEGGEEVVGRADGVEIAGEVQVDVFHRQHLCVAAARRAAFHAKDRAERGLAQGDDGALAETVERVGESDGDGGFAFARGRRVDGGNEDEFAGFVASLRRDFRFVFAVVFELVFSDADFGSNGADGLHFGFAGDVGVGHGWLRL